jgi:hypothetical protein
LEIKRFFVGENFTLLLSNKTEEARKVIENALFLPQAYFSIDIFIDKENGEIMYHRKVF